MPQIQLKVPTIIAATGAKVASIAITLEDGRVLPVTGAVTIGDVYIEPAAGTVTGETPFILNAAQYALDLVTEPAV